MKKIFILLIFPTDPMCMYIYYIIFTTKKNRIFEHKNENWKGKCNWLKKKNPHKYASVGNHGNEL